MDKEQALHYFYSQFGVPAYDEYSVPDEKRNVYPRITYEISTGSFGNQNILTFSLWDRSTSWANITSILHNVESIIGYGGQTIKYDGGMLWVKKSTPFAQRMGDVDDSIRRIVINIEVEFLSEV